MILSPKNYVGAWYERFLLDFERPQGANCWTGKKMKMVYQGEESFYFVLTIFFLALNGGVKQPPFMQDRGIYSV